MDWLRIAALLLLEQIVLGCAHAPPTGHSEHWNACVRACAEGGGSVVAAVEVEEGPGCVCQKPKEAT